MELFKSHARFKNLLKLFFTQRVIGSWNSLPAVGSWNGSLLAVGSWNITLLEESHNVISDVEEEH